MAPGELEWGRWWRVCGGLLCVVLVCAGCRARRDPEPEGKAEASTPRPHVERTSPAPNREVPSEPPLRLDLQEEEFGASAAGLRHHVRGAVSTARGIVVLFHGYGAQGDDLVFLAEEIQSALDDADIAYLMPEAPFALPRGRAWFRRDRANFDEGLGYAKTFVTWAMKEYPRAHFVIGGFSQGAMLTTNLLADANKRVRGGLILSPADWLKRVPGQRAPRVPLLISHGTVDQILPYKGAVRLRDQLQELNYPVKWIEFYGRHAIPPVVRSGIVEQVRGSFEKL